MKGHQSSIIDLAIHEALEQVFSYDKDGVRDKNGRIVKNITKCRIITQSTAPKICCNAARIPCKMHVISVGLCCIESK